MLKLVKFDFRRNQDQILAVFVITILLQIGIKFTISSDQELFMMNIVAYILAGMVLLFFALRTFDQNLRFYNRKLLPVPILYTVLSPLLLFLGLLLGVFIVGYIHLGIYIMLYTDSFLPANFWSISSYALLLIFWSSLFAMLFVMFSITVARSVRMKGSVWIGLATFFVIQNVFSFIENWLFGYTVSTMEEMFQFKVTGEPITSNKIEISKHLNVLMPVLFEAAVAFILIVVMIKLIKNRVES